MKYCGNIAAIVTIATAIISGLLWLASLVEDRYLNVDDFLPLAGDYVDHKLDHMNDEGVGPEDPERREAERWREEIFRHQAE